MASAALGRCLVLGAQGFIGRHVMRCEALFASELAVRLIGAPTKLDIRDAGLVRSLINETRPDIVIHLAALTFVPDTIADPVKTYETNFIGTLNVLHALAAAEFEGRMLFASSAEVYGTVSESELPIRETHSFAPRTPYAVSKAAGELLCVQYKLSRNLDVRIARPFNVIGQGQSVKFAVSSFAHQIARLEAAGGGTISVGNLDVTRDFIDVEDTVAAFVAILREGRPGEAYNVCSGEESNLNDVLQYLLAAARVAVEIRTDAERVRPLEQRRVLGDCGKLKADTRWRLNVPLAASLERVLNHWRANAA